MILPECRFAGVEHPISDFLALALLAQPTRFAPYLAMTAAYLSGFCTPNLKLSPFSERERNSRQPLVPPTPKKRTPKQPQIGYTTPSPFIPFPAMARFRHHKPRTPWAQRPRRQRKSALIRLKNDIRANAKWLGGLFMTRDVINGNDWADVYFLSADGKDFYNATLETARCAYAERLMDAGFEYAESLAPMPDFAFGPVDPATGCVELLPEPPNPAFGGKNRYEVAKDKAAELASQGACPVFETIEIDRTYRYGIGLHATIDTPELTIESVSSFIESFLASGESPFTGTRPITFSPDILDNRRIGNALSLDPSEWADSMEAELLSRDERTALESQTPDAAADGSTKNL